MVVLVSAELDERKVGEETKDKIVSQWREVCADEKHQLRDRVDKILRPLGDETRLVVMRRDNTMHALAMYFICMTLSAVMSLRDQWCSRQLRDIVTSLFTFLSGATVEDSVPEEDEDDVPEEDTLLFAILSGATVEDSVPEDVEDDVPEEDSEEDEDHVPKQVADFEPVERLSWPLVDYDRCLGFFSFMQGKRSNHKLLCVHCMRSLRVIFIFSK